MPLGGAETIYGGNQYKLNIKYDKYVWMLSQEFSWSIPKYYLFLMALVQRNEKKIKKNQYWTILDNPYPFNGFISINALISL